MRKKILMLFLVLNSIVYGKMFDIGKFSSKLANKNVTKLAEEVSSSTHIKQVALKTSPEKLLSNVALNIANKSRFSDKLMARTAYPVDVLRQYAKYGDKYLTTMKEFNQKSLALSPEALKSLKEKFPSMPIITFKNKRVFNDKMVEALRYTGKKGWRTTQYLLKLAKNNPKSTMVAGMYAWYVTDPQSFFEQKEKLIEFVGSTVKEGASDVTKVALSASEGMLSGFTSVIQGKMTFPNILVLVFLLLLFIVWKLRSYITKYLKIKIEHNLDKTKKKDKKGLL